mmetsp:Transcript_7880/g.23362  ORF Transcript_7880/g.23362 Transcript_7880/m.23362 type:complete len:243 (-) Transcript_7880:1666-2394(-)
MGLDPGGAAGGSCRQAHSGPAPRRHGRHHGGGAGNRPGRPDGSGAEEQGEEDHRQGRAPGPRRGAGFRSGRGGVRAATGPRHGGGARDAAGAREADGREGRHRQGHGRQVQHDEPPRAGEGDEAPVDALGGPRRRAPGAGARCEAWANGARRGEAEERCPEAHQGRDAEEAAPSGGAARGAARRHQGRPRPGARSRGPGVAGDRAGEGGARLRGASGDHQGVRALHPGGAPGGPAAGGGGGA